MSKPNISATIRHLRAFQMVAQLRNIRKAADAVRLTQPAVTLAIAKLEMQVEAVLFERRSRGTYLTREGEILAERVDRMFRQVEAIIDSYCSSGGRTTDVQGLVDRLTRAQIKALCSMEDATSRSHGTDQNVSRASTQRSVRDLERTLGIELVFTGPSGVLLNPTGQDLARRIKVAMTELDSAIDEIAALDMERKGHLTIGTLPMTGSFLAGMILNQMTALHPSAQFSVRSGDYNALSPALLRGDLDMILGLVDNEREDERLRQEPLLSLSYVIVARQNHPLSHAAQVDIAGLERYEWLAPNLNTVRRRTYDALFAQMSCKPQSNIHASSLSTTRLLLRDSDRLALMTSFEYQVERQNGGLIALPYGPIEPGHALGVITRANWQPTPLHQAFIDLVRREALKILSSVPTSHEGPRDYHPKVVEGVQPRPWVF